MPPSDADVHGDFRILTVDGVQLATGHCTQGDVESPISGPPVPTVDHVTLHAIGHGDYEGVTAEWF